MPLIRHTLPREQRLRSKRQIDRLFSEGEGGFVYPLRYIVLAEEANSPDVSLLITVPKRKHKRAHDRNRLKRLLREAYRLHKELLRKAAHKRGQRLSLGLIYTADRELDYATIEQAVRRILEILATAHPD